MSTSNRAVNTKSIVATTKEWIFARENAKEVENSAQAIVTKAVGYKSPDVIIAAIAAQIDDICGDDKKRKNNHLSAYRVQLKRAAVDLDFEKFPSVKAKAGSYATHWKPIPIKEEDTALDSFKEAVKEFTKAPTAQGAVAKMDAATKAFAKARRDENEEVAQTIAPTTPDVCFEDDGSSDFEEVAELLIANA